MKKVYITLTLLIIATTLAFITRFYKLGEAPAGLYLDEAAQGYNAYSILKTGKDEFGKSLPVVFRSFTDFKTPVYIYLVVPLIPIFDLSAFTVRFPSFFFSLLTIPLFFILIKTLVISFPLKGSVKNQINEEAVALISSFLLALSPWHILFGRTNFECNVALFFFLCGTLFFYKSLKKPYLLIASAIFFALAIPSYHAQRLVTPLMVAILFLRHKKQLLSITHFKHLIVGALFATIIILPTLSVSNTPGFLARAGLNIFNFEKTKPAGHIENCDKGPACLIINNRYYLHTREFFSLYVSYFSPRNMFYLGDYGPRSSFPTLSTFFLWQLPFYLIGFYQLFKNKNLRELGFFTISLLLISPLPAAVTRDPYTTIRALQMVIPQIIIVALGIYASYFFLKARLKNFASSVVFKTLLILSVALTIIYSLVKLYSSVIILNEYKRAAEWNWGFEELVDTIKDFDSDLPVVVDNARTEPYSQLLFFLKFDPKTYQKENFEVPMTEYYTNMARNKTKKIGNIITRPIDWEHDLLVNQYLIGDALAISEEQINNHKLELISEIKYPDGIVAFRIVKTNAVYELQSRKQIKGRIP